MIAVSIASKNIPLALEDIKTANEEADIIELRLDFFSTLSEKDLEHLVKACRKPVICTCRRMEEGGLFKESESKRIAVLKKAIKLGVEYIDLEFETKKVNKEKIFEYLKKHKKTKVILSKHFFGNTPLFEDLKKLMEKMGKEKHDVLKIVTKANTDDDPRIIFSLLREAKRKGIRIIAFCMGRIGRDSRILSMPLGSFLTFASLEKGKESAEGQIPIKEMKKIYAGLRVMF
ncbi:MAG TPA: type I 3-dehydroquinate dehydratase [archaeon]|nr:type I 3-dehydroquinate dehydratase [archaeon]